MNLRSKINNQIFTFKSVTDVLAKANSEKSGDALDGIAAESATERVAAKLCLSRMQLKDIYENPVIPYEDDAVTRLIYDDLNTTIYKKICNWTVSELREYILSSKQSQNDLLNISRGLTSEMIAAAAINGFDIRLKPKECCFAI